MENPQNLPPSLIVFIFLSLILCIWSIVDIVRSNFTRLNKVMWLAIVLFAPFGIFIYFFIGRRMKPAKGGPAPAPGGDALPETQPARQTPGAGQLRRVAWPLLLTITMMAMLCVVIYLNAVSLLGREKTGWVLISAMVVVVLIMTLTQIVRSRRN